MRRLLLLVLLAPAARAQDAPSGFPQPGSNIPGPFALYNATGKYKGRFHCLVSEYAFSPVVMVVVRGVEMKEPGLKALLVKTDNMIDKNPKVRMAGFVVFLTDALKDLARDDDKREELETKLEDFRKDANLKHVVLGLQVPGAMDAWKLEKEADVTVILYKEYRTIAVHNLTWEQLKGKPEELPAKVKEILDQAREKFGATH